MTIEVAISKSEYGSDIEMVFKKSDDFLVKVNFNTCFHGASLDKIKSFKYALQQKICGFLDFSLNLKTETVSFHAVENNGSYTLIIVYFLIEGHSTIVFRYDFSNCEDQDLFIGVIDKMIKDVEHVSITHDDDCCNDNYVD